MTDQEKQKYFKALDQLLANIAMAMENVKKSQVCNIRVNPNISLQKTLGDGAVVARAKMTVHFISSAM